MGVSTLLLAAVTSSGLIWCWRLSLIQAGSGISIEVSASTVVRAANTAALAVRCIILPGSQTHGVIVGASDGTVVAFNSSDLFLEAAEAQRRPALFGPIKLHEAGVNDIAVLRIPSSKEQGCERLLVATAGDDQAIGLAFFRFEAVALEPQLRLISSRRIDNAHASSVRSIRAISGVGSPPAHQLLSLGYDRRLRVWSLDLEDESYLQIVELAATVTHCAEPSVIAAGAVCAAPGSCFCPLVIAGRGVETARLSIG